MCQLTNENELKAAKGCMLRDNTASLLAHQTCKSESLYSRPIYNLVFYFEKLTQKSSFTYRFWKPKIEVSRDKKDLDQTSAVVGTLSVDI